jgi:hypothetical protein
MWRPLRYQRKRRGARRQRAKGKQTKLFGVWRKETRAIPREEKVKLEMGEFYTKNNNNNNKKHQRTIAPRCFPSRVDL